jgi:hypothetical protein
MERDQQAANAQQKTRCTDVESSLPAWTRSTRQRGNAWCLSSLRCDPFVDAGAGEGGAVLFEGDVTYFLPLYI